MTDTPYNPIDYETWPDEQKDFAGRVWRGLHDGDLRPLAQYLRAGHYIDPSLGGEIADAIERKPLGSFHIIAVGRHPGQKGMTAAVDARDQKMRIGVFMEHCIREAGKGGYESAMASTREKYSVSKSTVTKAHRFVRDHLEGKDGGWRSPEYDAWEFLRAFYLLP